MRCHIARTVLLLWLSLRPALAGDAYEIIADNPGLLVGPQGIVVDDQDRVYVCEPQASEVLRFSTAGEVGLRIPVGWPCEHVTLDGEGNVYTHDYSRLFKFTSEGARKSDFVGKTANKLEGMVGIAGICVDRAGAIHVANDREKTIVRLLADGRPDTRFGTDGKIQMANAVHDLDIDDDGNLYTVDRRANRALVINRSGAVQHEYRTDQDTKLSGWLCVWRNNVYVAVMSPPGVLKLDRSLTAARRFSLKAEYPLDLGIDSTGGMYLTTNRKRLLKFTADALDADELTQPTVLGAGAYEDGHFAMPTGLALDGEGRLLVCEYMSNRVQLLSTDDHRFLGVYRTRLGAYNYCLAVADDGSIFVGNMGYNRVLKMDGAGRHLWEKGRSGAGVGEFNQIRGLATDGSGHLYVAEGTGYRAQKFDGDLNPVPGFGGSNTWAWDRRKGIGIAIAIAGEHLFLSRSTSLPGKFHLDGTPAADFRPWGPRTHLLGERVRYNYPRGHEFQTPGSITVDDNGDVYVADGQQHHIKKFRKNGQYVASFGSFGYAAGQMRRPYGLLLDGKGHLYFCDRDNSRVYRVHVQAAFPEE